MFYVEGLSIDDEDMKTAVTQLHGTARFRLADREEAKEEIQERIKQRRSAAGWQGLDEVTRQDRVYSSVGQRRILQNILFDGTGPEVRQRHVQAAAAE